MGFNDFKERLGKRESGGRYDAVHGSMLGKYQFSPPRLCDLGLMCKHKEQYFWLPPSSRENFLSNEREIQERTFKYHIRQYIRRLRYNRQSELLGMGYSWPGLLGVAHLLGFYGMIRWAKSSKDKKYTFVDGLGTSGNEYYDLLKDCNIDDFIRLTLNYAKGAKDEK